MAANTYTESGSPTNSGIGLANREDLLDFITMISPTQTPFFSSVAKGKAAATTHEWLTDTLADVGVGAGAQAVHAIEGADPLFVTVKLRTRLSNFTQIVTSPFQVTRTQDQVSKAGIGAEVAYQAMKAMKEHVRNLEHACFANLVAGAPGLAATGRQMKSVGAFVTTSVDNTDLALTEPDLNDAMEDAWKLGGEVDTLFCTPKIKRKITSFTVAANRTANVNVGDNADHKLVNTIDVYEGDFGMIQLIADRFIGGIGGTTGGRQGTALMSIVHIMEMSRWRFDFLMNPRSEELAKTGDGTNFWIVSEGCVVGLAPDSSAELFDVLDAA